MSETKHTTSIALPDDIRERLLDVGRVEWGTSFKQEDEKHIDDLRDTLRITREYFDIPASQDTAMHGIYLEGTNTVLAHTGMSPNSPQHARILAGAWNQLVDIASADEPASISLDAYDAGLLGDGGGGDVSWWHDYIRSELDRAHEFYSAQLVARAKDR
ncbi:hypothetical protein [Ensifer sp. SL37]|uniref:hypothetical protein n=1 Tax=Ensifer sp. SL37 TaxID=2995137 RepID=UPI002274A1B6|nr:hypothetical protein [Ensifer sp. SL37]MCY1741200.1 hypothetical protein [Ensifer sp. SL37]